jgi:selenoprotein W-related protein
MAFDTGFAFHTEFFKGLENKMPSAEVVFAHAVNFVSMKSIITIEYCPKCGWMLRAAYVAQELLTTFTGDIRGVLLEPSTVNGTFRVMVEGTEVFDRKREGRFPETKELKQLVRDIVAPEKDLGHSDRKDVPKTD